MKKRIAQRVVVKKKISMFKTVVDWSCREQFFNVFARVGIFTIFENNVPSVIRCKIIFEKNKSRTVSD